MGEIFDCTSIRRDTILLNRLNIHKMNSKYNLYFDESGNTRCFWIKDGKYNTDPFTHFVLGGIVANSTVDLEYAKSKIGCNPTVAEIKVRNVCKGSFEDILKSKKFDNYLDLLIEQNWYVHFSVVELFYYAIVDIVDSVSDDAEDIFQLKDELYKALRYDLDRALNMMIQYKYPNVEDGDINKFLLSCVKIVDNYIVSTESTNNYTYKLRMLLQLAQDKRELVFIQKEECGSLLRDFLHFYQRPIYMFKNSNIVFDEELSIQEEMASYQLLLDGVLLDNYQFVNSVDNVMVQISDVFVGVLARYFRFINTNIDNVDELISKYNKEQINSFCKLNYILNCSCEENSAFWDMFLCDKMRRTFTHLVEKYSLKRQGIKS